MNKPLTAADLAELERMLGESGVGEPEDIRRAAEAAQGLGLFVRSLVGLDRDAAKEALAGFAEGKTLSANQIEFVNLIVDHLTEHGVMDPAGSTSRRSRTSRRVGRMACSNRRCWTSSFACWRPCVQLRGPPDSCALSACRGGSRRVSCRRIGGAQPAA